MPTVRLFSVGQKLAFYIKQQHQGKHPPHTLGILGTVWCSLQHNFIFWCWKSIWRVFLCSLSLGYEAGDTPYRSRARNSPVAAWTVPYRACNSPTTAWAASSRAWKSPRAAWTAAWTCPGRTRSLWSGGRGPWPGGSQAQTSPTGLQEREKTQH